MKQILYELAADGYEGTIDEIVQFLDESLADYKLEYEVNLIDRYTRRVDFGGIHGDFVKFIASSIAGIEVDNRKIYKIDDINIYTVEEYDNSLYANSDFSFRDIEPSLQSDDDCSIVVTITDTGREKENLLKLWRKNALLTQEEMSREFQIPKRTIENWEQDTRQPPKWAEKLIVEKLMLLTEKNFPMKAKSRMFLMKPDKEGKNPIGSWATIVEDLDKNKSVRLFSNMQNAIDAYYRYVKKHNIDSYWSIHVSYVVTNEGEEDYIYRDIDGVQYSDYDTIEL